MVSIGPTLPEVMVSTTSAVGGHGEIAYGNAIGSVICNAALIAAVTIAVRPGRIDAKALRTPVFFFFAAAAIYAVTAWWTGYFSRPIGLIQHQGGAHAGNPGSLGDPEGGQGHGYAADQHQIEEVRAHHVAPAPGPRCCWRLARR